MNLAADHAQADASHPTPEQIEALAFDCVRNTKQAAVTLYPRSFPRPFSKVIHDPMFDILDDHPCLGERQKRGLGNIDAILEPRGTGKTTIVKRAFATTQIAAGTYRFVLVLASSYTKAKSITNDIRAALESNEDLIAFFGPQVTDKWSEDQFVTQRGVVVMPAGAGQNILGLNVKDQRPDLIIIDDLEDPEDLLSEDQRTKLNDWFFNVVVNLPDRGDPNWRIIMIGTVHHQASLILRLTKNPKVRSVCGELCDDQLRSNWPEFMSDRQIQDAYELALKENALVTFYLAYRNLVTEGAHSTFKRAMFRYYSEKVGLGETLSAEERARREAAHAAGVNADAKGEAPRLVSVVICDPARYSKSGSDMTGIVVVGVDRAKGQVYVRQCIREHKTHTPLYDLLIDTAVRWGAYVVGIEVTNAGDALIGGFTDRILARGSKVQFRELHTRNRVKDDRVAELLTFYQQGRIFHNQDDATCAALEEELVTFPRSEHDDLSDALAYMMEFLMTGELGDFAAIIDGFDDEAAIEAEMRRAEEMFGPMDAIRDWGIAV